VLAERKACPSGSTSSLRLAALRSFTTPLQLLLKYRTSSAGPCKVLLHPRWGSHVYPATLFAIAPLPLLVQALEEAAAEQASGGSPSGAGAGADAVATPPPRDTSTIAAVAAACTHVAAAALVHSVDAAGAVPDTGSRCAGSAVE